MEGETSWEGQGFTLVIFVCVVVLCSVFFILGMLAGRSQFATASVPAAEETALAPEEPEEPDLTFYESAAESELPGLDSPDEAVGEDSTPPALPQRDSGTLAGAQAPAPPAEAEPPRPATPEAVAVMLQVGAFSSPGPAESLSEELVDQGYPAFVLRPDADDIPPLSRVRIGPFSDNAEVERVRTALEAEGHNPILVQ